MSRGPEMGGNPERFMVIVGKRHTDVVSGNLEEIKSGLEAKHPRTDVTIIPISGPLMITKRNTFVEVLPLTPKFPKQARRQ